MTRWVVIPGGSTVAGLRAVPQRDWRRDAAAFVTVGAVAAGFGLVLAVLLGIGWAGDHAGPCALMLARVAQATARVLEGG